MSVKAEDLINKCAFCFKELTHRHKTRAITDDIEMKFKEFVQYELISKNFSSQICSQCHEKLTDFITFKQQLQDNQINLENSLNQVSFVEDTNDYIIEEYLDEDFAEIQTESAQKPRQICPICAKYFSIGSIEVHMKRKHSNKFSFYCDHCPQKFKIKRDMITHLLKHTNVEYRRKFQCEFCENTYMKNSSLQHHIKMRHEVISEEFKCECGAAFKTKLRLTYHKKITHENGQYRCEECNKIYPSMHNLKIHISHFHKAKNPCIYCGKLVAPGTFMKRHMKIHEPASHECDICQKSFTARETLIEHQRTVHAMGETHYCENCGKSFGSKKVLKRHIERSHTISEKVKCEVDGCTYAASRKDNLINHLKIHRELSDENRNEIVMRIRAMRNLSW